MGDKRNSRGQMSNRELIGWIAFILVSTGCAVLPAIFSN
jgi:hypothetical protein